MKQSITKWNRLSVAVLNFYYSKPDNFGFSIILLKFQLFQIIKVPGETHSIVVIHMVPADKKMQVFPSNSLDLYLLPLKVLGYRRLRKS